MFIVAGLVACIEGISLAPGNFHHPGPGFFPFLDGVILIFLASLVFITSFFNKEKASPLWVGTKWYRTIITMGILLSFPFALRLLGFVLSASITMSLLFYHSGLKRWSVIISASVGTSFLCYFIFTILLRSEFPRGLLGLF
ncbi:tripartite tricarboxylate transporter TctB family protein [Thermodesulfobacteriota bacterium]